MRTGWKAFADEIEPGAIVIYRGQARKVRSTSVDGSTITVTFDNGHTCDYRPTALVTRVVEWKPSSGDTPQNGISPREDAVRKTS